MKDFDLEEAVKKVNLKFLNNRKHCNGKCYTLDCPFVIEENNINFCFFEVKDCYNIKSFLRKFPSYLLIKDKIE